ncbi:putative helicase MAGATAMA 3 [Ranunculus cassubicifolius]
MAGVLSKDTSTIVSRFHKIVLSWDYLNLIKQSQKKMTVKDGIKLGLKPIKDTYKDVDDYINTFEPLLFEEVKAQIVQGRDEDSVSEWKMGILDSCVESDGFHVARVGYDSEDGEMIAENDMLLISKEKFQDSTVPSTYAFALVLNREGSNHIKLRTFLAGEVQLTNLHEIKPCERLLNMRSVFKASDKNTTSVWILKIASLSTIVREYVGLWSISSLPFKELILTAAEKDSSSEDRSWKIAGLLMKHLEDSNNKSQMDAIRAGLSRKTFVLIQGPPGTGKTQTILGLLSAILHSTPARVQSKGRLHDKKRGPEFGIHEKYNHWQQASPWLYDSNPRDQIMPIDGDDGFFPTTGNELKPEVVLSNRKYRVRVLVCAPSNSALDEIVLRVLSTGIRDENDRAYNPKIVRIGLKPHHSVHSVSMDYLVEQKLAGMNNTSANARKQGATEDRDSMRASVLEEAAIVFSTLSFSGSSLFTKMNHVFDVVIIDEAAQAVEPATLIPLANGCKQVFLVGDPVQLPATVISPIAEKFGYGMSMFKRLQRANYKVEMLDTQYRMHPQISKFPSQEFYEGGLHDGPGLEDLTERAWHVYRCFGPFAFFDVAGVESQPSGSGSWVNHDEVEFILLLYHKLVTNYPDLKSSAKLAIITPYRHQLKLIRDRFHEKFGVESKKLVDINTVDGFQGREKDVAIFSCVRANKQKGIGFLADFRRMNVGITRAKSSVLVVGSASALKQDNHWKNLVESAESRDCLFKVPKPYESYFSDKNLETMQAEVDTGPAESLLDEMVNDEIMNGNVGVEPEPEGDYGDDAGGGFDGDE